MENTGILNALGLLTGPPTARGALHSHGGAPEIIQMLLGADNLTPFAQAQLISAMTERGMDLSAPGFRKLTPMEQLGESNKYFDTLAAGILDPESNEFGNARMRFRAAITPALKLSRTPVDNMGTMERLGRGAIGSLEDLGLGATQLGNEALRLVGAPGADERAVELRREAQAMGSRKRPLYGTTEGQAGRFLPPLLLPVNTIPGALGGGATYAALQPQSEEGERLKTIFRAFFGPGQ